MANVESIKNSGEVGHNYEDQKRLELREKDLAKVNEALSQNEIELTKMDELTQAISEMKSLSGTSHDLTPLLSELEELAQRAKKY